MSRARLAGMLLVLALAGMLASCQFVPSGSGRTEPKAVQKGTEGLAIAFLSRAPPDQIYERERFPVQVVLENKGTADLRGGYYVLNYEEQLVSISPPAGRFDLRGRSTLSPVGDKKIFRHEGQGGGLDPEFDFRDTTVAISACYPYTTDATLITCVDTDILGQKKNKPCALRTEGFSGGQGAPVAITSISPEMLPSESPDYIRPRFTIEIENVGGGDIVDPSRVVAACGATLPKDAQNIIDVHASLSDEPLECAPRQLDPAKGQNRIICTLEQGVHYTAGTYPAQLRVELEYGYVQSTFTSLQLLRQVGVE
jgi:hypothetical protein